MKLLAEFRKRRALKRYAQKLPGQLFADYGASEHFTPAQINAAVAKLKLDREFIVYGYAGFLPEATFSQLAPQMPDRPAYEEVRAELLRYGPPRSSSSGNFYESGLAFPAAGGEGGTLGGP